MRESVCEGECVPRALVHGRAVAHHRHDPQVRVHLRECVAIRTIIGPPARFARTAGADSQLRVHLQSLNQVGLRRIRLLRGVGFVIQHI